MIPQVAEQLGRDQKVSAKGVFRDASESRKGAFHSLPSLCIAGHLDELIVNESLVALVHALIDLIDERERRARDLGDAHEVHDRR